MPQARKLVLVRHKIRRGESLAAIAQRYGTTAGDLIRINKLKKAYRPRVGRTLLVPAYVSSEYLAEKKAKSGKTYKVRRGDTLEKIARRFGVSVGALAQANHLDADELPAGKRLIIPGKPPAAIAVKPDSAVRAAGPAPTTYRVRRGDSLWDIAKRFGVTVKELMDFNNLSSHIVAVGTVIRIP
jgi:LysM repeat protein